MTACAPGAILCASIGAGIAADRTLGGLCDWVEAEAPRPVDLPVEGAASLKAAVITVVLHYSTPDNISRGARGGPERRTQIVELASGDEERTASWVNSRAATT